MTLLEKTLQTVGEARLTVGVNDDDLQAGYNNVSGGANAAGGFLSFPAGASLGTMKWFASNQGGNFASTCTNAAFGQAVAFTIPDPVSSTANFILNKGVQAMATGGSLALDKGTAITTGGAAIVNKQTCVLTTPALTTAAGAAYTITLTNSLISTSSGIQVTVGNGTNTLQTYSYNASITGASTAVINIYNYASVSSLNGTLIVYVTVL